MQHRKTVQTMAITAILLYRVATAAFAADAEASKKDAKDDATRLPGVEVRDKREGIGTNVFPSETEGTKIYSGKKATVIDLTAKPPITQSNYRQTFDKTPGLIWSEENNPLVSLGYRGLPPGRAQYLLFLKDGLPIPADMVGYPESYYTPPLDSVQRIEFIRGGAALMYGPQPGGAMNFVTFMPRRDRRFAFQTTQIYGTDDYFSSYAAADGTVGRVGYFGGVLYRHGDGPRQTNSDFELFSGDLKLALDADKGSRWILSLDGYSDDHGTPGGLTFTTGPNDVNYNTMREGTSRPLDRFELQRYFGSLEWQKDISDETLLTVKSWGGYYNRYSHAQRGGGFGSLPTGAAASTDTIELQRFYTAAIESRLRHDWHWGEHTNTFAGGAMYYHMDAPRWDKLGAAANARDGVVQNQNQRENHYFSLFAENRFVLGKLAVTPGVRLENFWLSVDEQVNVAKAGAGTPLGRADEYAFQPLFGVGITFDAARWAQIYANASQAYRPKVFQQAVPTGANSIVPADLDSATVWQYEAGVRGTPASYFYYDTSFFMIDFDNQVGTVALAGGLSSTQNVGRSVHVGWEAATEFDIVGFFDALNKTKHAERIGSFSLFGNVMLLNARFESGPNRGFKPQYAPQHEVHAGVNYRLRDHAKISLSGLFVSDHFADDVQTPNRYVPAYSVWDLTAEIALCKDRFSIVGGINNLFNEDYYSRITANGIEPSPRRNFYVGGKVKF